LGTRGKKKIKHIGVFKKIVLPKVALCATGISKG
jgi:hypothetical protein